MKYLKKFKNHIEYEGARQVLVLPNVSLCTQENEVHYGAETRVLATYNVTSTSTPTPIIGQGRNTFTEIEVDGVVLPSVDATYQFDTLGEHTVKYTLSDPTSIGNNAFARCTSLTSVTIPNSVTSIGNHAFETCVSLTSVTIPDSVTSIGDSVFMDCRSLTSVTIPDSVTSIGIGAFRSCGSLISIDIPNSVTSISHAVFESCASLTSVTIPNSVTSIGETVFMGCTSLTSVTIPDSVTSISHAVFQDCTSLTSVTIEATTPPTLGSDAFSGNASGRKIYVPSASVETYKTASVWSTYAADIEAIVTT